MNGRMMVMMMMITLLYLMHQMAASIQSQTPTATAGPPASAAPQQSATAPEEPRVCAFVLQMTWKGPKAAQDGAQQVSAPIEVVEQTFRT